MFNVTEYVGKLSNLIINKEPIEQLAITNNIAFYGALMVWFLMLFLFILLGCILKIPTKYGKKRIITQANFKILLIVTFLFGLVFIYLTFKL